MQVKAVQQRRWALIVLGLLVFGQAVAAGLEASIDRTRVAEGDTVTLSVTAPGDTAGAPDLGPLRNDFDILDQGQSTRMTIVNGRASSTREWRFVLAPKRSGRLTIPSLTVDGLSSSPLGLDVVPASQAGHLGQSRPVMVEVEAEPKDPFVQGQVIYKVRLLYRIPLRQANLSDPTADNAMIQKLGDDKHYTTYRAGQRYQVIERRYAVFPQRSGTVSIDPPVLSGAVVEQRRSPGPTAPDPMFGGDPFRDFRRFFGRDPFADMDSMFAQTRPIQVRGRRLSLDVKPQPAAAPSPWLPAESVQISETWSPDPPVFRVGDPVTWTIAITAQGVSASQLPDITPSVPSGIKVYPDKAQTKTRAEGDDLVAIKIIKLALVPTAEGTLTLPEVRLPWWDTQTNQQRFAVLPAHTIKVLPPPAGVAGSPPASAPAAPAAPAPAPAAPPAGVGGPTRSQGAGGPSSASSEPLLGGSYWPWIAAGLVLIWLATVGLWVRERGRSGGRPFLGPTSPANKPPAVPPIGKIRARIERACLQGDARGAREALIAWSAAHWPTDPPRRLETIGQRFGGAAGDALRELDRQLYGSGAAAWDGAAAWSRLEAALIQAEQSKTPPMGQKAALPDLYPQRG
jgi:hypothetical protein